MRIGKRLAAGLAIVAASALALSACSGGGTANSGDQTTPAASGPSGEIHAGVAYETTNWSPVHAGSALANGVNWHVLEGLYNFDMSNYSVSNGLAAGDPTEVGDLTYEVKLRDGAKFSDGSDVTSADVVASYKRNSNEGGMYTPFFSPIKDIVAKDDTTVTITLNHPFAKLKERLALIKIVPAAATDEELTAKPIGTGPFKYESISEAEVVAVPNEHYNGSSPALVTKMVWKPLKDDSARLSAALDGSIDVMEAVPASAASSLEAAGWTITEVEGYNNPFLMFNTSKAPFDKPEVRQAFHYAIDTQKLIDSVMEGKAVAATSFLPKVNPDYKEAATQFGYDANKAKELLAGAGVSGLEITLVTTDHPWIANLAPQIKADLEAIGLKVNVQSQASADVYANFADVENPTFDVILAPGDPATFGNDAAIFFKWWYGDNVWMNGRSQFAKSNPETFQKILTLQNEAASLDGAEAKAKWGELQDLVAENAVIYPLFHRTMITAFNPAAVENVKAIATTGLYMVGASHK